MTSPIRGRKRQEYIDNWLRGEEDPNIEVIPTRSEGKYIVRQKVTASEISNNNPAETHNTKEEDDNPDNTKEQDDNPDINGESDKIDENPTIEKPVNNTIQLDQSLTMDILNQLKMINDERREKREKKEKKKQLRHAIHKEFARSRVLIAASSDDEEIVMNEQPHYNQQMVIDRTPPQRMRRRLNLLDRYR